MNTNASDKTHKWYNKSLIFPGDGLGQQMY
jgi:hypothetical protein